MRLTHVTAVLLTLAATACATVLPPPPPRSLEPPPIVRPPAEEIYSLVTANPDAARILAGFRARSLKLAPSDVSRVDLLAGSPGYAWRVGQESLHIHAYRNREWAAAGARRFIATAMSRSQIIDWVATPHLFQCGTTVVLYLGESPHALTLLTYLCGPPAWMR